MTFNPVMDGEFWFLERHSKNAGLMLAVREHIYSHKSRYQLIEVFDTFEYGRILTLDRLIMLSERDESAYHEMLVHVPMFIHPSPKRVLVVGGGDGGTLREVVKHPGLELAVQVEIDEEVVNVCREYMPGIASAYDHTKVRLVIQDALVYLKGAEDTFDVVIIDSTDPIGPAASLFEIPFYRDVFKALREKGVMTCQLGSSIYNLDQIVNVLKQLQSIFTGAQLYMTHVPTYPSGLWTLGIASKGKLFHQNPDEVRYRTMKDQFNYYNNSIHFGSFMLPEYIKRALKDS